MLKRGTKIEVVGKGLGVVVDVNRKNRLVKVALKDWALKSPIWVDPKYKTEFKFN